MNIDDQCSKPKRYTVPEYRIIECQLGRYEVQVEASLLLRHSYSSSINTIV